MNYTLVQSCADSALAVYVSKNMSAYTEIVIANCNGNISDDEIAAISLLNNDDVEPTAKKRYVELLSTIIAKIAQVKDPSLWASMIDRRIVAFSVTNFINYFQQHGIDASITKYINDEPAELDFMATADAFGKETAEKLYDAVAICNNITTDKYRKILVDLGYSYQTPKSARQSGGSPLNKSKYYP